MIGPESCPGWELVILLRSVIDPPDLCRVDTVFRTPYKSGNWTSGQPRLLRGRRGRLASPRLASASSPAPNRSCTRQKREMRSVSSASCKLFSVQVVRSNLGLFLAQPSLSPAPKSEAEEATGSENPTTYSTLHKVPTTYLELVP